ncbi:hypothetical protein PRIPAC_89001 [Pristionchus pacificus]|uniref:Uncharacterized protein n=1 Tax=Pristionchus pacificus TaxID=54126 RepID=A0A2A6B3V6_PRIPA|nr:hypothetical protein PRIPAC_89001 [Pristionchus pacificus]|eukprot:PDM60560.1 hypothetical protein PRIPAC_53538 [Pristionchus pacificus]
MNAVPGGSEEVSNQSDLTENLKHNTHHKVQIIRIFELGYEGIDKETNEQREFKQQKSSQITRVVCSSETRRALALAEFIFDSLGPVGSLASEK